LFSTDHIQVGSPDVQDFALRFTCTVESWNMSASKLLSLSALLLMVQPFMRTNFCMSGEVCPHEWFLTPSWEFAATDSSDW